MQSNNNTNQKPAQYATNNSNYGQGWLLHEGKQQVELNKSDVPTYAEIVRSMQDFKKAEKLIRNKMVAEEFGKDQLPKLTEEEKARRKIDNRVPPKPFHVKAGEYTIPQQGMNIGSPVYETTSMQYGQLEPGSFELHAKYYPRNNQFTTGFQEMTYKFDGLNTSVAFSKVHQGLNEY